jgi:hypothetical protein
MPPAGDVAQCPSVPMIDSPTLWKQLVDGTSERIVVPLFSLVNLPIDAGNAQEIAVCLLVAVIQISVIALLFRPLESWLPAERWTGRYLTRTDRQYTLLMVFGVAAMPVFVAMMQLGIPLTADTRSGWLALPGPTSILIFCFPPITSSSISCTTGCIARSTPSRGHGRCTACTTVNVR